MKIIDAHSRRLTRPLVTLVIEAEDGVIGLGDATLNGRELAVASYLRDHVIPCSSAAMRAESRTPGSTSTGAPTGGADR